jgi:predicted transcriptional regulator
MMGDWTFFSNYGHVLVCLARNREARLRDVALEVGITERAVQKIVRDLQDADMLVVTKQGRCNRYRINKRKSLRHVLESHCTVGQLLNLVAKPMGPGPVETREAVTLQSEFRASLQAEEKPRVDNEAEKVEKVKKEKKGLTPDQTREQGSLF